MEDKQDMGFFDKLKEGLKKTKNTITEE